MKHYVVKYLLVATICFLCKQSLHAQRIYVKDQPGAAIENRPAAPRPDYVWIPGEWISKGKTYVYQPGHWVREQKGWYWVKGHWTTA